MLQNILKQVPFSDIGNVESLFPFVGGTEIENFENNQKSSIGKYQLLRLLGKGGMGIVFLAWDQERCQEVALKMLKSNTSEPGYEELLRLAREIKALSTLKHKNIVEFYEAGEVQYKNIKLPCFSMEYIKNGKPLHYFLEYPNSIEWTIGIIKQVAYAFAYAHQKNILHRDIKPSNIVLDSSENPKVLDFGLAKILGETESFRPTQEKYLSGSPQYISPEQYKTPLNLTMLNSDPCFTRL
ncbi:MAG: serine/threonine protein kinase [Candidatus Brocadiae bacterium]|nr:serine/threonine protein kinase [Candidatus Brocadiia bacterium]